MPRVPLPEAPRDLDRHLPSWARRSHPVVRRHLGPHWKTTLPEVRPLLRRFAGQAALILLSLGLPHLVIVSSLAFPGIVLLPVVFVLYGYLLAAALVLPFALILYGYALLGIGAKAATALYEERQGHTLLLLRATPLSLRDIFLSQIASGVWRQGDNLSLAFTVAGWFSLPPIFLIYAVMLPTDPPLLSRLAMILALAAALGRLFLEPLMVGALGIALGAAAHTRITALLAMGVLTSFYFLLLNLPRLLALDWPLRLLVEVGLPLALPLLITWGAFRAAAYALRLDR